jgi:peptidoglycan hydrolase-like protein with peptidoglycan-binding domain
VTVSAATDFNVVLDNLKVTYGKDLEDYRPKFTVLQELLTPNRDGVEMGAQVKLPVILTHQGGETYDTSGGTATLRAPVSMEIKDATSDQFETTMVVRMPFGLISKSQQSSQARFADKAKLILLGGKKGALRAAELSLLHGSNGIGQVQAVGSVTGSGPWTLDVTFTPASWSDGIWGAAENMPIDWFSALTSGTKRNTGDTNVQTVKGWGNDGTNPRKVTFVATGASGDLSGIAPNDFAFAASAYTKQMQGMLNIAGTGTGTTLFGISTNYSMYRAKSVTVSGPLTMGKLLSGISPAIAHGAEGKLVVLVNARNHADLLKDMASARRLDASYSEKTLKNGARQIIYISGDLTLEITLHPFMKDGDALAFSVPNWYRIGSDPDPTMQLADLKLQVMSSTANTFDFRFWNAQVVMPDCLATTVLFSGITPVAT